jgi:hypothetical protein
MRKLNKLFVAIERANLYEPVELAVSVGGDSLDPPLSLPALPNKE